MGCRRGQDLTALAARCAIRHGFGERNELRIGVQPPLLLARHGEVPSHGRRSLTGSAAARTVRALAGSYGGLLWPVSEACCGRRQIKTPPVQGWSLRPTRLHHGLQAQERWAFLPAGGAPPACTSRGMLSAGEKQTSLLDLALETPADTAPGKALFLPTSLCGGRGVGKGGGGIAHRQKFVRAVPELGMCEGVEEHGPAFDVKTFNGPKAARSPTATFQ